ncbi:MAG TPA: hypothetical protein VJQ25_00680, partial [Nitrospira sp.]|nr:hypothetical protein [Nitrospira sp.]
REWRHRVREMQRVLDREAGEKKTNEKSKRLRNSLRAAGRKIADLRSELSRQIQKAGESSQQIEIATDRITELEDKLARRDQEIDDLKKVIQISEYADKRFLLEQVYKRAFAEGRVSVMEGLMRQGQMVSFLPAPEEEKRLF